MRIENNITMCANEECPLAARCMRNPKGRKSHSPSDRQSWCFFVPDDDGNCEFFWGEDHDRESCKKRFAPIYEWGSEAETKEKL